MKAKMLQTASQEPGEWLIWDGHPLKKILEMMASCKDSQISFDMFQWELCSMMQCADEWVRSYAMHLGNAIRRIRKNFPGWLGTCAQIKELHRDRFFKCMHNGIRSELHHLISNIPAAKKPKFFKLVEAAVRAEEWILWMKKRVKCMKDAKATTFIPQAPWKPKSLGLEFPNNSENECMLDKDEDVSPTEDAIGEDLLEQLEALSCHSTVVSEEDKKGVCYMCGKKGHQMVDCNLLKLLIKNAWRGFSLKSQAWKVNDKAEHPTKWLWRYPPWWSRSKVWGACLTLRRSPNQHWGRGKGSNSYHYL